MKNLLDKIIEDKLMTLKEEKYKLRLFQVDFKVRIESKYGVEETLQDIRSIPGVTVVTALDSIYQGASKNYTSDIRIKFHPRKEATTAPTYVSDTLVPAMNSNDIPGLRVLTQTSKIVRIS